MFPQLTIPSCMLCKNALTPFRICLQLCRGTEWRALIRIRTHTALRGDVKTEIRETKGVKRQNGKLYVYNPDIEYGGAGMVLADYDDSYYIFATQDNSHFEFSDRIISAETGAFADGAWVSNGEYTPENGYTVTPKAGKVYRIRFSKGIPRIRLFE